MLRLLLATVLSLAMSASATGADPARAESKDKRTAKAPAHHRTLIHLAFGPRQVWVPSNEAVLGLAKCAEGVSKYPGLECVHGVMALDGASEDAFEFYRLTGSFLQSIPDTKDVVRAARIVNPWLANENEEYVLVGGSPAVVRAEDPDLSPTIERDGQFKKLKAEFPELWFWQSGSTLEGTETTKEGQRFVFRYRLLDGCRACPTRGWARVRFAFQPDGTFRGARLLDIVSKP